MLNNPSIYTAEGLTFPILGISSKTLYYTLVRLKKPQVTSQSSWNDLFPVSEEDRNEYWSTIYRTPYKAARDTKLHASLIDSFLATVS